MPDGEAGQPQAAGQVVTFYSFKGGTGRTMALANVAWILAANGKRVLVADWDLESPGLHRFFQPFMDADISSKPGIIDFIRRYEWSKAEEDEDAAHPVVPSEFAKRVNAYVIPISWTQFPPGGSLAYLGPGKQLHGVYEQSLSALDWDNLYDHLSGGIFFDALREELKNTYDYVLIDSKTGLSDIPDICTLHLPDIVVDCFTLSTQGIEGAATIAGLIQKSSERDIIIYPVPMRIDPSQQDSVMAGLQLAADLFDGLPAGLDQRDRERYWDEVRVPYLPSYAYEEKLAAFGDRPGDSKTLLPAYQRIAGLVTGGTVTSLPPLEEWLRLRTRLQFTRTIQRPLPEVVIQFSSRDQLWGEWIAAVLAGVGVYARLAPEVANVTPPADGSQVIAVASEAYFAAQELREFPPEVLPDLLVSVTDVRMPSGPSDQVPVIFLADLQEEQAVDLLIDRIGGRTPDRHQPPAGTLRYPGGGWNQISNVPSPSVTFTGRDPVLLDIREKLRSRSLETARPLTVSGVGGVGKTQVALEYAQRFKADYDVVWWVNCAQSQYIDQSLADLGTQLRAVFGASIAQEVAEAAPQVLEYLSYPSDLRWLLIYDDVAGEDLYDIEQLLPRGGGHVLITSRENFRPGRGTTIALSVFQRTESVDHLRRQMPEIPESEADELAAILGDVPLAIATAGALLASENLTIPAYLELLDQQAPRPSLPMGDFPESTAKAWHLSLDLLQRKSPAAARLLGICSVMAPVSSFDLVVSDAMVDAVQELDPSITERSMINLLIGQIDQLALIKVDQPARQMQVHQIVQEVVRQRLDGTQELAGAREAVHQILVSARPAGDVDDPATWPGYQKIWPHLTPSQAHLSLRPQVRDLLIHRVRYLWLRDDLERGRRRAEEVQYAWRDILSGQQAPARALVLQQQLYRLDFNLANILRRLGRYEESLTLDQAVLRGQEELIGQSHQYTLMTRSSLSSDLQALGSYRDALTWDLDTYKLWVERSGFGVDYPLTLTAAHSLALSYLLIGDSRQALRYDLQTLERRIRVYGNMRNHPEVLASRLAVGRDLLEVGRYDESVRITQEAFTQAHETYGSDARVTLSSSLWLGIAQRRAGDAQRAMDNIDTAADQLSRIFGLNSTESMGARLSQALNRLALGRFTDGRTAAEELLAEYQRRLGPEHPHSLICQLNVATALCLEGEFAAARAVVADAIVGLESRIGALHPSTLAAKLVLASALAQTGELSQAEELERQVAADRAQVLGAQHPDTLRGQANLLLTQAQINEDDTTEARRATVIQELSAQIGPSHPDVHAATEKRRLLSMIDPQ